LEKKTTRLCFFCEADAVQSLHLTALPILQGDKNMEMSLGKPIRFISDGIERYQRARNFHLQNHPSTTPPQVLTKSTSVSSGSAGGIFEEEYPFNVYVWYVYHSIDCNGSKCIGSIFPVKGPLGIAIVEATAIQRSKYVWELAHLEVATQKGEDNNNILQDKSIINSGKQLTYAKQSII